MGFRSIVVERANPYVVRDYASLETSVAISVLVVFGQAAQKPFGTVAYDAKIETGRELRRVLGGE